MYDIFSSFFGCLELLIFMIIIFQYIYLEDGFQSIRGWIIYFSVYLLSLICVLCISPEDDWFLLVPFVFFIIFIFINRKKHRLRGIFLIIPMLGILFSTIVIPYSFLYLFTSSMASLMESERSYSIISDIVIWAGIIAIVLYGRKQRSRFYQYGAKRQLTKWERYFLNGTGLLLLVYSMLACSIDSIKVKSVYSKTFIGFGIIFILLLEAALIAIIIQGNNTFYFQNAAAVNKYYLNAQLEHFKAYKETQRETRRIRHDMKNQIACLYTLIESGSLEESRQYIEKLNDQVLHISKELYCGNDIADAILNEKSVLAAKEDIHIHLHGTLGNIPVDAVDMCTIFANALDNAVEALKDTSSGQKDIEIEFKARNNLQYITFRNPVAPGKNLGAFLTTKRDLINHGFGLENIRLAVKKYNGQMDCRIAPVNGQDYFILEILLFLKVSE